LNALLGGDVLLDFLDGHAPAAQEIARYRECCISIISWMEVMAGAQTQADAGVRRGFLAHFRIVPLTPRLAEEAVNLRREHRLKLPDAVIWANAVMESCSHVIHVCFEPVPRSDGFSGIRGAVLLQLEARRPPQGRPIRLETNGFC